MKIENLCRFAIFSRKTSLVVRIFPGQGFRDMPKLGNLRLIARAESS